MAIKLCLILATEILSNHLSFDTTLPLISVSPSKMKLSMKYLSGLFFIASLSACTDHHIDSSEYITVEFENFHLRIPDNWRSFKSQGYDSKVGGVTNGRDSLFYDLGFYAYDFRNQTTRTHARIETTINGKPALIVRPIKSGKGIIGLFIQVESELRFSLSGTSENEGTILRIFESVTFL
jgi:hypothetical protein